MAGILTGMKDSKMLQLANGIIPPKLISAISLIQVENILKFLKTEKITRNISKIDKINIEILQNYQ